MNRASGPSPIKKDPLSFAWRRLDWIDALLILSATTVIAIIVTALDSSSPTSYEATATSIITPLARRMLGFGPRQPFQSNVRPGASVLGTVATIMLVFGFFIAIGAIIFMFTSYSQALEDRAEIADLEARLEGAPRVCTLAEEFGLDIAELGEIEPNSGARGDNGASGTAPGDCIALDSPEGSRITSAQSKLTILRASASSALVPLGGWIALALGIGLFAGGAVLDHRLTWA